MHSTPAPTVRSTWWHRNRWPLLAFGLLAVATPTVILGPTLRERRQSNPTDPIVADVGASVQYGDATVGPATAALDNEVDPPPGAKVLRVSVAISDATTLVCATPTLHEIAGPQRRFSSLTTFGAPSDQSTFDACDPIQGVDYDLNLTYLVPDDAAGPFVIEIESSDLLPRYVELKVQP